MILTERDRRRFWSKVDKSGGEKACWNWIGKSVIRGYGSFWLASEQAKRLAHRVAFVIEHGAIPKGEGPHGTVIRHTCDNRLCCNPLHLVSGSQYDNVKDAMEKGRHIKGEIQGNSKLTESQVKEIKRRYAAGGVTQRALGREYDIGQWEISRIVRGHRWRHVA